MKVKAEIEKYGKPADVPVLLWLFERYHWASQWSFVARCTFEHVKGQTWSASRRIWEPTNEGRALYSARKKATL